MSKLRKKTHKRTVKTKATVIYRGKPRQVVVTVDKATGMLAIRLHGCKTRRTYHAADLWKPVSPQLSFAL